MTRRRVVSLVAALAACLGLVALLSGPALAVQETGQAEAGEAHGEGASEGAGHAVPSHAPDINWVGEGGENNAFMFLLFNFGVLVALLAWKGGPAIRRYVESRHTLIRDALDEAAKIREDAQKKLDEYSARIADVDAEVDQLVSEVRADAEKEKERIIAEAHRQAEQMKKDAESRISAEFSRARYEIEREVVAAAIAAAEKLLREQASAKDKSQLVDEFITGLESQPQPPASPGGAS